MPLDYQNFKRVPSYRTDLFRLRAPKHATRRLASKSLFFLHKNYSEILHGTKKEGSSEDSYKNIQFFGCGKISQGGLRCLGIIELYGCSLLR